MVFDNDNEFGSILTMDYFFFNGSLFSMGFASSISGLVTAL